MFNFEKEKPLKPREQLLKLEKTGKYVFHGSLQDIEKLEPRQAYNYENGKKKKDGDPAIFATPYADVAIFRALTNNPAVKESSSSFGINDDGLFFSASKKLLIASKKITAKVYVLDKDKFESFQGMQCKSLKTTKPIKVIEVNFDDLPPNITIIKPEKKESARKTFLKKYLNLTEQQFKKFKILTLDKLPSSFKNNNK